MTALTQSHSSETYLWCFSLLYSNPVKTLNEVVQHLCLLTVFNGEVVTAGIGNTRAARASHTLKHTKSRHKALGKFFTCAQSIHEYSSANALNTPSHHTHGSVIRVVSVIIQVIAVIYGELST